MRRPPTGARPPWCGRTRSRTSSPPRPSAHPTTSTGPSGPPSLGWRPVVEPGAEFVIRLVQSEGALTRRRSSHGRAGPPPDSPRAGPARADGWRTRWLDAVHARKRPLLGQCPGPRDRRPRRAPAVLRRAPDPARAPPDESAPLRPGLRHQRRAGQGRRLLLGHVDVLPPVRAPGAPGHARAAALCSSRSTRTTAPSSTSTTSRSGAASTSRATPTATGTPPTTVTVHPGARLRRRHRRRRLPRRDGSATGPSTSTCADLATAWRSLDTRGEGSPTTATSTTCSSACPATCTRWCR